MFIAFHPGSNFLDGVFIPGFESGCQKKYGTYAGFAGNAKHGSKLLLFSDSSIAKAGSATKNAGSAELAGGGACCQ
jgi:hypothetical protein